MRRLAVACVVAASLLVVSVAAAAPPPVWSPAGELSLPTNAATSLEGQNAVLNGVSCPNAGNCVGVGWYLTAVTTGTDGPVDVMAASESGGTWEPAQEIQLPAGAHLGPGAGPTLNSVACTSVGNCEAAGQYPTDSIGDTTAMVVNETSGVWGQAAEVALPNKAMQPPVSGSAATRSATLSGISCTGPGDCEAVGTYIDTKGQLMAMVVNETNGIWSQAEKVGEPAGVGHSKNATDALNAIACSSTGNCEAVGSYGPGGLHAMVVTETRGTWRRSVEVNVPSDAL